MREGWKQTTLGELCELYQPQTISQAQMQNDGKYLVYGANGPVGRYDRYNHEYAEVVVTCRGATCGVVNMTPPKCWITGNAMVVRPNPTLYMKGLMFHALQATIDIKVAISGSAQPQITRSGLAPIKVLLPPLTEQKRIVDVIGAVDAYVAALESYATAARTARAALLHELLTTNTKGWKETTLGEVAEARWGNTSVTKRQYQPAGYVAYSASGPDGFVDWFEHDEPAVVLSAIGALCGKTWLADGKWTPIKNTIWFRPRDPCYLTKFLFLATSLARVWPIRGQAQSFIALGDVRQVQLQLPPLVEQKRIVDVIESVDGAIAGADRAAEDARNLRSGLLSDLLSGDHEIPESYDELLAAA